MRLATGLLFLALAGGAHADPLREREAIRTAVTAERYDDALMLVERATARLLRRDPNALPILAELAQWRALIAGGQDDPDLAVSWFRTAFTLDPAWTLDEALASPTSLRLIREARRPPEATGWLRVVAEPGTRLQIDREPPRVLAGRARLPVGNHRVVITPPGELSHAQLVEITEDHTTRLVVRGPASPPSAPRSHWYVWLGAGLVAGSAATWLLAR